VGSVCTSKFDLMINILLKSRMNSCFPHIVNLACKAVLSAITKMDFAKEDSAPYEPPERDDSDSDSDFGSNNDTDFLTVLHRDPVASLRSVIQHVSLLTI